MDGKKVVLITGYEPFGGDDFNPSLELAKLLDGTEYNEYIFKTAKIPVSRKSTIKVMENSINKYEPEIILCTGLAWGRAGLSIERVATNVADFPIPDNEGYISKNEAIDTNGPEAYFSTIPIRVVTRTLLDAGIPAYVSNSAGTFGCNLLMYGTLNYVTKKRLNTRVGFIHVPFTPEQVAERSKDIPTSIIPSMSLDVMVRGIKIAVQAIIDNHEDIEMICGHVD